MAWIAMGAIFLTGGAIVCEEAKGLGEPPPKKRKVSKGTAYATIVVGVLIMAAGVVVPLVAF
jgi:hypothetical protein